MANAYEIRIVFLQDGIAIEERIFRRVVDRSVQGAITKVFQKTRIRNGSHGGSQKSYGCEKLSVEIRCLGNVDR